jgi:hypothetical protein
MRILAYDVDRVELAIWGIRRTIRATIKSRDWNSRDLEGVKFLAYLGDTEVEAFQGGSDGGGFAFISNSGEDDDDGIGGIWLIGIPLLLVLLLLAAAFTFHQYLRKSPVPPVQESKKPERALVGTGDHPKSTHRGSYHYSADGQQYLSTRCGKCIATRKEYFYYLSCAEQAGQDGRGVLPAYRLVLDSPKDDCMGTIMENEPYDYLPVRPDMHTGLAKRHWGNDVHNCGSALCQRCSARTGSPIFIKTRKAIDPEASEQVESVWIDPSLRTSPEHAEV